MKKKIILVLCSLVLIVFALTFVACSSAGNDESNGQSNPINFLKDVFTFEQAYAYATDLGFSGTLDEFVELLSGKDGKDGIDGKDGANGKDGKDGVSVEKVELGKDGHLYVTLSNDTEPMDCGMVSEQMPTHVHTYSDWFFVCLPTCTVPGLKQKVCSECGYVYGEVVEAAGHNVVSVEEVAPTCTSAGWTKTSYCDRCGEVFEKREQISALGHSFTEVVQTISPTCTDKGYTIYKCEHCEMTVVNDYVNALGHDYDENDICTRCGDMKYFSFELQSNDTYALVDYTGDKAELVVPSKLKEKDVSAILYIENNSINTISFGNHIKKLDIVSFGYLCQNLSKINYIGDIADWCKIEMTSSNRSMNKMMSLVQNGDLSQENYRDELLTNMPTLIIDNQAITDTLVIPNEVRKIPFGAFVLCTKLKKVYIPNSVIQMSKWAFFPEMMLDEVHYDGNIREWCAIEETNSSIDKLYSMLDFYPVLAAKALYIGGEKIEGELVIPEGVSVIRKNAFNLTRITSVIIPESVTKIDTNAFWGCYNLVEVYNKSALDITVGSTENGRVAEHAKAVYTEPYESKLSKVDGFYVYTDEDDKILVCYVGEEPELTLPSEITKIGKYAMKSKDATSITIPSSLLRIDEYAFAYCTSLEEINYEGTCEQWAAIEKASDWDSETGEYVVHCSDGDIAKTE